MVVKGKRSKQYTQVRAYVPAQRAQLSRTGTAMVIERNFRAAGIPKRSVQPYTKFQSMTITEAVLNPDPQNPTGINARVYSWTPANVMTAVLANDSAGESSTRSFIEQFEYVALRYYTVTFVPFKYVGTTLMDTTRYSLYKDPSGTLGAGAFGTNVQYYGSKPGSQFGVSDDMKKLYASVNLTPILKGVSSPSWVPTTGAYYQGLAGQVPTINVAIETRGPQPNAPILGGHFLVKAWFAVKGMTAGFGA